MNLKQQLIRGFSGNIFLRVLSMLLALGSGVMLARLLGPEQYGTYTFVLSIIALLGLPTQGGVPTLVIRETAKYQHAQEYNSLKGLLRFSGTFVTLYSFLAIVIASIIVWNIWDSTSEQTSSFLWALLLLPIIALSSIRSSTLTGLRKVVQGSLPEQIIRPLVVVSLLGMTILFEWNISASIAIQYTLLGAFMAFVIGVILLMKSIPVEMKDAHPEFHIKLWVKSLLPLVLFSSLNIANSQIGVVFLGFYTSHEDIGYFRVAFQGASLLSFSLVALNAVLAPHIIRLYKDKDYDRLQKMLRIGARVTLGLTLPFFLTYIFFGDVFVRLLFGEEYLPALNLLIVMCIGQFISVAMGSVGLVLNMLNHEKETVRASLLSISLNVLLCLILIPSIGVMGAAIATTVSLSAWNILLAIRTYKLTKLNATSISLKGLK